jgi:hypothetical protein
MTEDDVLRLLLARRDNYEISQIAHLKGRLYRVIMGEKHYTAVVLFSSFDYYQRRYHLAKQVPTLCICFSHDTVLPFPCLSLVKGNLALAYELPEKITDIETQRTSRTGSQVLLGMYLSGVRLAQDLVDSLPPTTRKRYLRRVEALGKRRRGRPVSTLLTSG